VGGLESLVRGAIRTLVHRRDEHVVFCSDVEGAPGEKWAIQPFCRRIFGKANFLVPQVQADDMLCSNRDF